MIQTDAFIEVFSDQDMFKELRTHFESRGYATDVEIGFSRPVANKANSDKFNSLFSQHYPAEPHNIKLQATAFDDSQGYFLFVLYDANKFPEREELKRKLLADGMRIK